MAENLILSGAPEGMDAALLAQEATARDSMHDFLGTVHRQMRLAAVQDISLNLLNADGRYDGVPPASPCGGKAR